MTGSSEGSDSFKFHRWGLVLTMALLGGTYAANADAQSFLDRLKNTAEKAVEKKTEQVIDDTLSGQAAEAPPRQPAAPPAKPRLGTSGASSGGRNCGALGAGCANGMDALMACMDQRKGHHFGELLAPALKGKLDAGVFTAGSREDLEYDLQAVKAAAAPPYELVPSDAARPHRYLDWLSPQEQADIMNESNRYAAALQKECNDRHARF